MKNIAKIIADLRKQKGAKQNWPQKAALAVRLSASMNEVKLYPLLSLLNVSLMLSGCHWITSLVKVYTASWIKKL